MNIIKCDDCHKNISDNNNECHFCNLKLCDECADIKYISFHKCDVCAIQWCYINTPHYNDYCIANTRRGSICYECGN